MRINRSTGHALRIMLACARQETRLIKVAELADELGLTQQNTFKIVHLLSQSDLISGARGRNGGVRLSRPARDISVGEIVRAIETIAVETEGDGTANAFTGILDDALLAFISVLERHSLADVAGLATADVGSAAACAPKSRQAMSRHKSAPAPATKRAVERLHHGD